MARLRFNWKRGLLIMADIALGVYLFLAFTAFNKPEDNGLKCTKVNIQVTDAKTNGFIDSDDIKARLKKQGLFPLGKPVTQIKARQIEESLMASPFVKTAECYITQDGQTNIAFSQLMPVVRVKASNGADYYIDDKCSIMPNTHYTSDLIIATGNISQWYARNYISYLAQTLMGSDFWKSQIVQINVLADHGIELVPRVGNHIIYIGALPEAKTAKERQKAVAEFTRHKLDRLEKFYKYGLSEAGWNKYSYINLEFDNQIICKKRI